MQFNCTLYKMNLFRSPLSLNAYFIEEKYRNDFNNHHTRFISSLFQSAF